MYTQLGDNYRIYHQKKLIVP